MNLFYKIHLQAFNVISIVLYHSGPKFGQVFYSCLNAFVVDASDYSGHLIRHLLNVCEAFPTEWFHRNKSKSGGLSPPDFDLFQKLKKPLLVKGFRSTEEVSNEVT
jgi:homogentisate 1,2-dioxygenase